VERGAAVACGRLGASPRRRTAERRGSHGCGRCACGQRQHALAGCGGDGAGRPPAPAAAAIRRCVRLSLTFAPVAVSERLGSQ
jgi:hypothetical protein